MELKIGDIVVANFIAYKDEVKKRNSRDNVLSFQIIDFRVARCYEFYINPIALKHNTGVIIMEAGIGQATDKWIVEKVDVDETPSEPEEDPTKPQIVI